MTDNFLLRWGIASCGRISNDFVNALQVLPTSQHKVVGVAARKLEDAQAFAKKWSIPEAYGSYQELANNKDIDVIYVGCIHPKHLELSTLFMNAGKHVLCEKPLGMHAGEVRKMIKVAQEKSVFLMEGFWSRFFPVYDRIREELASGKLGDIMMVSAVLGSNLIASKRLVQKELGGGSLLDMGCYPLQFVQMVLKDKPTSIKCSGKLSSQGIDETMSAVLTYPGGKVATVSSCSCAHTNNVATIAGTKGQIVVPQFWCPQKIEVNGDTIEFPLQKSSIPMGFLNSEGFQYEAEAVRQCIFKGLKEHPLMTWNESITIAEIEDEIRKQLGVEYDADKQSV